MSGGRGGAAQATSALDAQSEALVQEALDRAMKQTTRSCIVIAHRRSTPPPCPPATALLGATYLGWKVNTVTCRRPPVNLALSTSWAPHECGRHGLHRVSIAIITQRDPSPGTASSREGWARRLVTVRNADEILVMDMVSRRRSHTAPDPPPAATIKRSTRAAASCATEPRPHTAAACRTWAHPRKQ